jgi:hypothetical protein
MRFLSQEHKHQFKLLIDKASSILSNRMSIKYVSK